MDGGEKRKIAVDRRGGKEYAPGMPREMQYELLFLFGSSTLKLRGRCAQRLRNILIGCKALEVLGIQHGQHVQGYVQRSFGIVDEMAHNHIVLAKRAIACNQPENFIGEAGQDRKSTRLNSSHQIISYAVFCVKKKTETTAIVSAYESYQGLQPCANSVAGPRPFAVKPPPRSPGPDRTSGNLEASQRRESYCVY